MKLYLEQKIILRKNLKLGKIEKKLPNKLYLVSYYNDTNKLQYDLIDEGDILDEKEYEIIKNRNNRINKLFD